MAPVTVVSAVGRSIVSVASGPISDVENFAGGEKNGCSFSAGKATDGLVPATTGLAADGGSAAAGTASCALIGAAGVPVEASRSSCCSD